MDEVLQWVVRQMTMLQLDPRTVEVIHPKSPDEEVSTDIMVPGVMERRLVHQVTYPSEAWRRGKGDRLEPRKGGGTTTMQPMPKAPTLYYYKSTTGTSMVETPSVVVVIPPTPAPIEEELGHDRALVALRQEILAMGVVGVKGATLIINAATPRFAKEAVLLGQRAWPQDLSDVNGVVRQLRAIQGLKRDDFKRARLMDYGHFVSTAETTDDLNKVIGGAVVYIIGRSYAS